MPPPVSMWTSATQSKKEFTLSSVLRTVLKCSGKSEDSEVSSVPISEE